MTLFRNLLLGGLWLPLAGTAAAANQLTVPLNYGLLRNVLVNQLYTAGNGTARLWQDGKDCSFLDVSNPQIGGENGQIRMENTVNARLGLQLGGKCLPALTWNGRLATWQQPTLTDAGNVLRFPVTRTQVVDGNGQTLQNQQLQELLNKAVQKQLAGLEINLQQARGNIVKTLLPFVDARDDETLQDTVNSLRFERAAADEHGLMVDIGFQEAGPAAADSRPAAAFSAAEMKQWHVLWQSLTRQLTTGLDQVNQASEQDRQGLAELLADAGTAFDAGLSGKTGSGENDPVRQFFNDAWERFGPLLRQASGRLPGTEGLQFLTLISATDVLYQLDAIARPLGLDISANGLRKLVRAYLHHQAAAKKPRAAGGRT